MLLRDALKTVIRLSPTHTKLADEQPTAALSDSATLALVGGSLDAFTYVAHGHVFANAMTGNVVLLGLNVVRADWWQALHHFFPIVSFFLGISTAEAIKEGVVWRGQRNHQLAVLSLEIAILLATGCLPTSAPHFLIANVVAFGASLQAAAFRIVEGHPYNSTFTTANLRSLSEGLLAWVIGKEPLALRRPVQIFAAICGTFLVGVVIGGLLTPILDNKTLWAACAVLLLVSLRLARKNRLERK